MEHIILFLIKAHSNSPMHCWEGARCIISFNLTVVLITTMLNKITQSIHRGGASSHKDSRLGKIHVQSIGASMALVGTVAQDHPSGSDCLFFFKCHKMTNKNESYST